MIESRLFDIILFVSGLSTTILIKKEGWVMMFGDLLVRFSQRNMVLFVGKNYTDIIDEKACSLPWKCIISTSSDLDLVELIKPERLFTGYNKIPDEICYSDSKDFVQLYGDGNIPIELSDIEDELTRREMEISQGNSKLEQLLGKIDARCEIVIAGYDSSQKDEMSVSALLKALLRIKGGSVSFWHCKECDSLVSFASKRGFSIYSDSIKSIVAEWNPEEEVDSVSLQDNTYIAYKNGKAISVPKDIVIRYEPIAQLLTDERVHAVSLSGKIEKSLWFYNFLNDSSDAPQWYGYSDNSCFYLERKYEKNLLALTKMLLEGKASKNQEKKSRIVVLEGASCSSKSIELGALAYKVFSGKSNPVIFIKGGRSSFSSNSDDIVALEELIHTIDDSDSRILIIWDSSSMKNVLQEAKRLARILDEDRGRRFVLVCSSYQISITKDRDCPFQQWDNVSYYNDCYFVKAERELTNGLEDESDNEIAELKNKVSEYAFQIDENRLQNAYKKIGTSVDIFDFYYRLIELIRPRLEAGVLREQRVVFDFARKQIHESLGSSSNLQGGMKEILAKAGFIIEPNNDVNDDDSIEEALYEFGKGVAMFSQFKLEMPYNLAIMLLCQNNTNLNNYTYFSAITTYIDFIHYNSNAETTGKATFSFRNIIEARKFLESNNCSPNDQMKLLLKMMDLFVSDAEDNNNIDDEVKKSIVAIIRSYGPNNEGIDYYDEDSVAISEVRNYFLSNLNQIIDKLQEIRGKMSRIDGDGLLTCQEVTLVREYYGMQWRNANGVSPEEIRPWQGSNPIYFTEEYYKMRLEKLYSNSVLAQSMLQDLELIASGEGDFATFSRIQNTISNLTVELCLSNIQFSEVELEYHRFCQENGCEVAELGKIKALPYKIQFNHLSKIIQKNQFNGYLYNTIFKLFFKEYNAEKSEDKKMELLSNIMLVADNASSLDVENRGPGDHDELSEHIEHIYEYAAKSDVSIKMIHDPNCNDKFKEVFERLLNQNHAAAICFVCQRELEKVKLDGRSLREWRKAHSDEEFVLNDLQVEKCKEIIQFMNNENYETAIAKTSQAIYLKILVYWMFYNRRPVDTGREWQRTFLTNTQWGKIQKLCEEYDSCPDGGRPIISLLHSLSLIQCGEKYAAASKCVYKHRDSSGRNQFVNYMICNEDGEPKKYSGVWCSNKQKANEGWIRVDKIKDTGKGDNKVRCNIYRMGWRRKPEENHRVPSFVMGLSYTGAYTARIIEEV